MDTKVLYLTAVVIAAMSGGYYYYSGKGKKLELDTARNMTYSAEGIHLLQTNEQGQLYVTAKVDHLTQDLRVKTAMLSNLNAATYHNNQVDSTFYAKEAKTFNDNEKVILTGQVKATKLGNQGELVFLTDELTGYPKLNTLETQKSVTVNTPSAQFISQGLKADLNMGQYEFFHIRGKYVPK